MYGADGVVDDTLPGEAQMRAVGGDSVTYTDSVNQFIAACVVRALARRVKGRLWRRKLWGWLR